MAIVDVYSKHKMLYIARENKVFCFESLTEMLRVHCHVCYFEIIRIDFTGTFVERTHFVFIAIVVKARFDDAFVDHLINCRDDLDDWLLSFGFLIPSFSRRAIRKRHVTLAGWACSALHVCLRRRSRLTLDNIALPLVLKNISDIRDSLNLDFINRVEARVPLVRLFPRETVDLLEACNGAGPIIHLNHVSITPARTRMERHTIRSIVLDIVALDIWV